MGFTKLSSGGFPCLLDMVMFLGIKFCQQNAGRSFHFDKEDIIDFTRFFNMGISISHKSWYKSMIFGAKNTIILKGNLSAKKKIEKHTF